MAMPSPRHFMPSEMKAFGEIFFALMASLPEDTKAGARIVLATIAAFEGRFFDGTAAPAVATIGRVCGMAVRTVHGHLDALHELERVATIPHCSRTSEYIACFPEKPPPFVRSAKTAPPAESAHDQKTCVDGEKEGKEYNQSSSPTGGVGQGDPADRIEQAFRSALEDLANRLEEPPAPVPAPRKGVELRPKTRDAEREPRRRPSSRVPPRQPPDLDLRRRNSPMLSPELKAALYALPDGRACGSMLVRRKLTGDESIRVVRRILQYDQKLKQQGKRLESAVSFGCLVLNDIVEASILQEAARHDGPVDPDADVRTAPHVRQPVPKPAPRPPPRVVMTVRSTRPAADNPFMKYVPSSETG